MHARRREIEAKFYLRGLNALGAQLIERGGKLLGRRQLERNWRFDRPDGSLTRNRIVLRLRQDQRARLTYKQPTARAEIRHEIEVDLDNAAAGRALLEALGFQQIFSYEKYRRTFAFQGCQVMLDELPFGCFLEIEGDSLKSVRAAADRLDLRWDLRVSGSYWELFQRLQAELKLPFSDASFSNFAGSPSPDLELLGLQDARAVGERYG